MKVHGYFDEKYEPAAPFVRALLMSGRPKIKHFVEFLMDTGAAVSTLLDKDVRRLKINLNQLRTAEKSLVGIGGPIKTYVMEDATIVLKSEEGRPVYENLTLFVGVHDLDKLHPKERELVLKLPSLLGRDIIYRFSLTINKLAGQLYLERKSGKFL